MTNHNHHESRPVPTPLYAAYAPLLALRGAGALEPDEARSVEEHVAQCAWCSAESASLEAVEKALRRHYGPTRGTRQLPTVEVIMAQAEHDEEHGVEPGSDPIPTPTISVSSRRRTPDAIAAAIAAAVIVLASVVFALHQISLVTQHPRPQHVPAVFPLPKANALPDSPILGPDGNVWFIERGSNTIARITPEGKIMEFPMPVSSSGMSDAPQSLVVGRDGNIWFTAQGAGSSSTGDASAIGRLTPQGAFTFFPLSTVNTEFWRIHAAVAGPDGNIWFVGVSSQISTSPTTPNVDTSVVGRVTLAGVITGFALRAPGLEPGGIVVGSDGNLWFTLLPSQTGGAKAELGRISPNSAPNDSIQYTPLPDNGQTPSNMVVGPDGALWFTMVQYAGGSGGASSLEYSAVVRMGSDFSIQEFAIPGSVVRNPFALTVGPDHNLWVALDDLPTGATDAVARLTPSGAFTEYKLPALTTPSGLAWGADGNLWVTELNANAVARLYPLG